MKKLFIGLLAAFCAIAGFGQPTPVQVVEATAAQVAAGTAGAPYYISPRRLSGGGGAGVFSSVTDTSLTAGRVVYVGTGGLLADSSKLTFDGTTLFLGSTTPGGITGSAGSVSLTGAGTNQNITLTPSGTGYTNLNGTTNGEAVRVTTATGYVRISSYTPASGGGILAWNAGTNIGLSAQNGVSVGQVSISTPTNGLSVVGPYVASGQQALSGAGAVDVTNPVTLITSTGSAQALTLANGTSGQIKTIVHAVDGGSSVLTPTTKTGFSTVTFTNAGESVTLQYFTTIGWIIIGIFGAVAT